VPEAGWYNDEADPALARWHDGAAWTEWVVEKAHWVEVGHAPPPPVEDEGGPAVVWGAGVRRTRMAIGAAVAAGVLVLAGVALATGGDGGSSGKTSGDRHEQSQVTDTSGTVGRDLSTDPSLDGAGGGAAGTEDGSSAASSGTVKRATSTTRGAGVTRTETRTESHTTAPITQSTQSSDQVDVGNSSHKDLSNTYVPPPPTTTEASTTTTEATTTTTVS
jgi:hypothetical protein